jgi:hypothetical protein
MNNREETMRRLGAYPKIPVKGEQLEGRVVLLDADYRGDDYDRLFVATGGFGCNPTTSGSAVMGFFVADGEKCRVERQEVTHVFDGMPVPETPVDCCLVCKRPMSERGPNEPERADGSRRSSFLIFGGGHLHEGCKVQA